MPAATERLRQALAAGASIVSADGSKWQVAGTVGDASADLTISASSLWSRRKSWNIAFHGVFRDAPAGSSLDGVLDIPDRRQLHVLMWLMRALFAMVPLLVVALAVRDLIDRNPVAGMPVVVAALFSILAAIATILLETEGEFEAGRDSERLVSFLGQTLA